MEKIIDLIIADDHAMYRQGVKTALRNCRDIRVVDSVENGEQLIHACLKHQPDVVLTDIVMPVMNGIEATKKIMSILPDISIVALTMLDRDTDIIEMVKAGAYGYLVKNAKKKQIVEAIKAAFRKESYLCDASGKNVAVYISNRMHETHTKTLFTKKELQIIEMVCRDMTSQEIADKLFIAKRTVDWHRETIMKKMGVNSNIGVFIYALKNGIHSV